MAELNQNFGNITAVNTTLSVHQQLSSDEYGKQFFEYTRIATGLYLYPILCIFGIFGSCFNFIIYQKSTKYSTNIYLIALSLSDLIKLINDIMYFIVSLINEIDVKTAEKIFNKIYPYTHYIFVLSGLNTSWLTCAIAFDRYVSICGHHIKKQPFNNAQSIIIIVLIVLTNALLSIPSPLFSRTVIEYDFLTNETIYKQENTRLGESMFRTIYQYISGALRAIIPFFLLIYLNFHIIRFVYKNKYRKKTWLKSKNKSRSTYMLITIVIVFIVCIFPDAIMTLMQFGYAAEKDYIIRGLREITDLFLLVNSVSTFPICFYFSIDYRTKFKECFLNNFKFLQICFKNTSQKDDSNRTVRETYKHTEYEMLDRDNNKTILNPS